MQRGLPPVALWVALGVAACGGGSPAPARPPGPAATRGVGPDDPCAAEADGTPAEPLLRQYQGVARAARCQREVYTIMGGVTHFLGVKCEHCHEVPDYPKMTHRKHIANWMARELIPRLARQDGGEIWCGACHAADGKGKAKLLGDPRQPRYAAEWMTVHLAGEFETHDGQSLQCRMCHGANLGSPEFRRKILLTDFLPPGPVAAGSAAAVGSAAPAGSAAAVGSAAPGSAAPAATPAASGGVAAPTPAASASPGG